VKEVSSETETKGKVQMMPRAEGQAGWEPEMGFSRGKVDSQRERTDNVERTTEAHSAALTASCSAASRAVSADSEGSDTTILRTCGQRDDAAQRGWKSGLAMQRTNQIVTASNTIVSNGDEYANELPQRQGHDDGV
jgi:hypothetical protein